MEISVNSSPAGAPASGEKTAFAILLIISLCHLLNDMMQTMLSAIYPLLQQNYGLSFAQVGIITLTFQGTASVLQPLVGFYIDRHPRPYSLAMGMGFTMLGLVLFSQAVNKRVRLDILTFA
jgi:FSR family fosmidomycin resistance protein-like MFS transporter